MKLGNNFTRHHSITHMNVVVAGNMLSKVRSFIIFQSGEGLTSFNKDNSANFSGEKKKRSMKLFGCLFLEPGNTRTTFKSNLVLESKSL